MTKRRKRTKEVGDQLKEVGKQLKMARAGSGMSQSKLGGKIGVSAATISNWELGKTDISITRLFELSKLLDFTLHLSLKPINSN